MKKYFYITITCLLPFISFAESTEVPFTLEDRDRLIRLEENVQSLQYEIREFKAEMREFRAEIRADIRMLIYTFFGGIFVLISSVVGFVLWDRRTTLAPVVKENNSIKQALIDFSEKNSIMKKALKRVAISEHLTH
ncbi:MAG: hypothetical protein IIA88_02905 [Bacteroidetes bacterium]|nr:hypothetical protein [Bacteroidota bacterium]